MKVRTLAAVTGALALTAGLAPAAVSVEDPDRIVGGTYATSNPGAASIHAAADWPVCTASVLDSNSILTARHCVSNVHSVRVGSLGNTSGGTVAYPTNVVTHSGADLAVITLDRDVNSPTVRLAANRPSDGSTNSIWGWGRTACDGAGSAQLKTANVRHDRMGIDHYGGTALESTGINGHTWKGDSGGPQFNSAGEQVGVASTATCEYGQQWYTSVPDYRSWIQSQM